MHARRMHARLTSRVIVRIIRIWNPLPLWTLNSPASLDQINHSLADGDGFQCSSSSASSNDYDDETLLKKLCVLLCMPQNAPQNT